MSFVVSCQCGKQFRVKDDQAGKKAKCPGCGTSLRLEPGAPAAPPPPPPPPVEEDADPFASFDLEAAAAMEREAVVDEGQAPRVAPPSLPRSTGGGQSGPKQKACPACGSMISAFAMRCEHCGASLGPGSGGAKPLGYATPRTTAAGAGDSDLSVAEWLLCILCGGIACIVGIVYMVQGKPKGAKMIGFGILFNLIWGVVRIGIQQYLGG